MPTESPWGVIRRGAQALEFAAAVVLMILVLPWVYLWPRRRCNIADDLTEG